MRPRSRFLRLERDDELRGRVRVACRGSLVDLSMAATATGYRLDELAEQRGLRRRIVEDEA